MVLGMKNLKMIPMNSQEPVEPAKNTVPTMPITEVIAQGFYLAFKRCLSYALGLFVIALAVGTMVQIYVTPMDSTDGAERSGMRLHVDNQTGCEYLSVAGGGITPRLNREAFQIGCR